MKVFVYFNLHKKRFSIKALEGSNKGLVIGHSNIVVLTDARGKVNEKGRLRVLRDRRKNVHAGIVGYLLEKTSTNCGGVQLTYNPYKMDSFQTVNGDNFKGAGSVIMSVVDKKPLVTAYNLHD